MASPRSRIHPEKVVSFKLFELEQKGKLKSAYPFLSADQINRKIKDLWRGMGTEQKQNYTRLVMKSTPVKKRTSEKSENKMYNDRKRKLSASASKNKKQKVDLSVCDTPETVNTKKLHDFRNDHTETYDNDFLSSPFSCDRRKRLARDVFVADVKKGQSLNDNTNKTGILKLSDSGKKSRDKSRVSFHSPADIRQRSQETDDSIYDGRFSDDDDDGVLLRRDDVIDGSLDVLSARDVTSCTGKVGGDSQSDDDEDYMSAVLIRREAEDEYGEIDRHEMVIDDGYTGSGTFNNLEGDQGDSMCAVNKVVDNCRNLDRTLITKPKVDGENKDAMRDISASDKTKIQLKTETRDEDADDESQLFKSPLITDSRRRNKKLKKKIRSKKGDNRSETVHTPAIATVYNNLTHNQVTPMVTCNQDSYTTPLMDENLQQLTFEEASKAPQKRRQSLDTNKCDIERLKALHSGRRVTRSLMIPGESKRKTTPDIAHPEVEMKSMGECDLNVDMHQMDPGGDARPITPRNSDGKQETTPSNILAPDNYITPDQCKPAAIEPTLAFRRKVEANKRENRRKSRKENDMTNMFIPHYNSPDVGVSPDLLDICNTYSSQSSDSSCRSPKQSQYTNPALEKALRNLRCTAAGSPSLSVECNSDLSSPGLLSPALSGVSELSSTSSGRMEQDKPPDSPAGAAVDDNCVNPAARNIQPATRSRDLCQLFKDVTPPDKKTKGQYKTQRLVSSGGCKDNKTFKQLFEDSDFLFC